ncbi:hypothetical protein CAF53_08795 [Sphingobium sp. LB126]|nr:hypothetical protein CAF53_08795 [Sphingobium sp. LB126]
MAHAAKRARNSLSEKREKDLARRLLIAAERFRVIGLMSSDMSENKFYDAVSSLKSHLHNARSAAWKIATMVPVTLIVDREAADQLTAEQKDLLTAVAEFFDNPAVSSFGGTGLFEAIGGLVAACDLTLAKAPRTILPADRGRSKYQSLPEFQRYMRVLAQIYKAATRREAAASDGSNAVPDGQSNFTKFVQSAFALAEVKVGRKKLVPGPSMIDTALKEMRKSKSARGD